MPNLNTRPSNVVFATHFTPSFPRSVATLFAMLLLLSAHSAWAQTAPTWSKDVASIVYSKCTPCHRPGEIAPFALENFADVVSNAYSIQRVVSEGIMPPWPPTKGHGNFMGDRSMTSEEIATIKKWIEAGTPVGNIAEAPKPPTFPTGSQLGTPDLVLKMQEVWSVKGNNKDVYRFFVLPSGLLQDKNVSAIEFRPGNNKVVHHVLYYQDTSGTARKLDTADPEPGYSGFGDPGFASASSFLGWVPGAQMRFFPSDMGVKMYKNSDLVIQVHYAPSSTSETDQSSVNIFFQKAANVREVQQFALSPNNLVSGSFAIPANKVVKFKTSYTTPLEISVIAVAPHMHLLGRNCVAYAVTPANDTIRLVAISDWDFHWQGSYAYKNLVKVPRNSKLYYEAEYDNTANNPENPNSPPRFVTWGESTTDEMLLCYFFWMPYRAGDEAINMNVLPVTGVEEETPFKALALVVGPNPALGNLNIKYSIPAPGTYSIRVVDVRGNVVQQVAINSALGAGEYTETISTSQLPTGAYLLSLVGDNVNESAQFVVSTMR
ncbi:MAG: T9SS type A sorting domain-containing protein [Ignavibacteria bacterium]|nr:T9SS type A sorting domain-containing protein [Ignavibacteria bacterium]